MQYTRITSYYQDGRFTSCEHLYHGSDQQEALEWFRREYPAHNNCIVVAEPYDSEENKEHFAVCVRCGCVH